MEIKWKCAFCFDTLVASTQFDSFERKTWWTILIRRLKFRLRLQKCFVEINFVLFYFPFSVLQFTWQQIIISNQIKQIESLRKHRCCSWVRKRVDGMFCKLILIRLLHHATLRLLNRWLYVFIIVTRRLGYFSIFGTFQQWKLAQHKFLA